MANAKDLEVEVEIVKITKNKDAILKFLLNRIAWISVS